MAEASFRGFWLFKDKISLCCQPDLLGLSQRASSEVAVFLKAAWLLQACSYQTVTASRHTPMVCIGAPVLNKNISGVLFHIQDDIKIC